MIQAIKKVRDFYHCCLFSYKTVKFNELWINLGEPEKTTGPSGVKPIAVLKKGVYYCRGTRILYLAFILRTYFKVI